MSSVRRARFWVESVTGSACGMLAMLTVFWRGWIEALTGYDPDHLNGSFEWAIVVALLVVCAAAGSLARAEWRRPRMAVPIAD
jgi:DMSO/TMAO reductase YedYZ heme-binding membrane subunit